MNDFRVVVGGLKELSEALDNLTSKMQGKAVRRSLKAAAEPMVKAARSNAPVETGALRKSIKASTSVRLARGVAQTKISYGKAQFYGQFVELGTSKMPARPFLRPAFDSTKGESADEFKDVLRKAITAIKQGDS